MRRAIIHATYEVEILDELELREAAFHTRHQEPLLAEQYTEDDDTVRSALSVMFGHELAKETPGVLVRRIVTDVSVERSAD